MDSSRVTREVLCRVVGLRVNDFMHLARGLFAFLASGGLQTHTRVFVIIARVGGIYRLACSISESSVIYFYGTILAAFRLFCVLCERYF